MGRRADSPVRLTRFHLGDDLLPRRSGAGDEGQPPTHLLLEANDRHSDFVGHRVKPTRETLVFLSVAPLDDAKVVRVENDHARSREADGRCDLR